MLPFRDLDKVRDIVKDATGLNISYAYDDMVFPDNVAFLIRFDDKNPDNLFCHFRTDCIPAESEKIFENLKAVCANKNCTLKKDCGFELSQQGEEIAIHFKTEAV